MSYSDYFARCIREIPDPQDKEDGKSIYYHALNESNNWILK